MEAIEFDGLANAINDAITGDPAINGITAQVPGKLLPARPVNSNRVAPFQFIIVITEAEVELIVTGVAIEPDANGGIRLKEASAS